MCGIVGVVDKTDADLGLALKTMLDAIWRRGPDGEGVFLSNHISMGMRRLSVIDIEGGAQPFFSENGQIVAFQNGEIYNYLELSKDLKAQGYIFISQSDTEVLAHGYHAWGGRELLQKLDGMFAIAIFDKRFNQLFLARDRFGEKPLYYSIDTKTRKFAYSSDARELSKLNWVGKKLSNSALTRYFTLGFTTGDQSIFEAVKKLPPAHYLRLNLDTFEFEIDCYYTPDIDEKKLLKEKSGYIVDFLDESLQKSVELRLQADVPVGVFLSGGIDSSLIAAIAAKKHPDINTFSIGFKSKMHDESAFANEVAKHIRSSHHHFIFDEASFSDFLPLVVAAADEPIGDQASLPTYWLSREARKYVTVALSGEGGDEVFGGYGYYKQHIIRRNENSLIFNNETALSGFPLLMSQGVCKNFIKQSDFAPTEYENNLVNYLELMRTDLHKAMAADLFVWLPDDLLVKFDRMSMANSLEGRTPFLSHKIVDFSYGLKDEYWISNDEQKILLRRVGKRYLPENIFNRTKQGFVLPMDEWIRNWFSKESPKKYFMNREYANLDSEAIARYVGDEIIRERYNQRAVFAIVFLFEWLGLNI